MKILMLCSSFDIGGAETHILELSRELSELGHEVTICSEGGEYVAKAEYFGIQHIKMRLNSKRAKDVFSSLKELHKLLKHTEYDVVHSHARLPSLIGYIVCKKLSIPFVTTAHWVFSLKQPARFLTRWGDKAIAVSSDIKNYLIENYNIYPDNIRVTVNGIDTKRFCNKNNKFEANKIIHISRLDEGRAKTAFTLVEIAPALNEKIDNLQIEIIGTGNCYDKIRQMSNNVNRACKREIIKLSGKRTDIDEILSSSHCIFVGVSRAALEAMSCKYPTILSGDEGYEGIFEAENSEKSAVSNFCCRGSGALTQKKLIDDILYLYSNQETAKKIGEKNRKLIEEKYSSQKMAADAIKTYSEVIRYTGSPSVVLCGYYGYGNLGDDATLAQAVSLLRSKKISDITVLSKTPRKTGKRFCVNSIYRYNFFRYIKLLKKTEFFLLGGGNLLQNQTSNRSLYYYGTYLMIAKKYGLSCYCFSSGVGELYGKRHISFVRKLLLSCEGVLVRSKNDYLYVKKLSKKIKVFPSFDIVLLQEDEESSYLYEKYAYLTEKKYAVFAIREPRGNITSFKKSFSEAVSRIYREKNIIPIFLTMQKNKDERITKEIIKMSECGILQEVLSPKEVVYLLKNAEFSAGMRMHLMIFSLLAKCPYISISYDKKCTDVFEFISRELNYEKSDNIFWQVTDNSFYDAFISALYNRKKFEACENISKSIKKHYGKLQFNLENNDIL